MKAMILRDDVAAAVHTARILGDKGFQTLCVASRDIASAIIRAETIDVIVMDERVGAQLTHTLALSAERRNPYVCTLIITDQGAEATDDLYALIPSLYALIGSQTSADILGKLVLCAVANTEEPANRVARQIVAEMQDNPLDVPLSDMDQADWGETVAGDAEVEALIPPPAVAAAVSDRRGWGQYADIRPHMAMVGAASPDRGASVMASA